MLTVIDASFDDQIDEWIEAAEAHIDKKTGRSFVSEDDESGGGGIERLFDGDGSGLLLIDDALSVSKVETGIEEDEMEEVEAEDYVLEPANKSALVRIIASNLRLDVAAAEEPYKKIVNSYDRVPYPNVEGIETLQSVLVQINPKLSHVRAEAVVDSGLISRLEASGFIKSIYKGQ